MLLWGNVALVHTHLYLRHIIANSGINASNKSSEGRSKSFVILLCVNVALVHTHLYLRHIIAKGGINESYEGRSNSHIMLLWGSVAIIHTHLYLNHRPTIAKSGINPSSKSCEGRSKSYVVLFWGNVALFHTHLYLSHTIANGGNKCIKNKASRVHTRVIQKVLSFSKKGVAQSRQPFTNFNIVPP